MQTTLKEKQHGKYFNYKSGRGYHPATNFKTMKKLELKHLELIIDWMNEEGIHNWGSWGHYPALPIGASYHSFDTCQVRIKLDEVIELPNGELCDMIIKGRPVGKCSNPISIFEIVQICKEAGIEFENEKEFLTKSKFNRVKSEKLEYQKKLVAEFETKYATYEYNYSEAKKTIQNLIDYGKYVPKNGTMPVEEMVDFISSDYGSNGSLRIEARLVRNSKTKKFNHYKVVEVLSDIEAIAKDIAEKRQKNYVELLRIHNNDLTKLLS